jgi:hypothetical protein
MAEWASWARSLSPPSSSGSLTRTASARARFTFLTTLWAIDALFYFTKLRVWWAHFVARLYYIIPGRITGDEDGKGGGKEKVRDWEEEIEQGMKDVARETLGVEIEEGASLWEG